MRLLLEDIPIKYLLRKDVFLRKSSERRRFAQKIFCQKILERKTPPAGVKPEEFSIRKRSKKMRYKEKKLTTITKTHKSLLHPQYTRNLRGVNPMNGTVHRRRCPINGLVFLGQMNMIEASYKECARDKLEDRTATCICKVLKLER